MAGIDTQELVFVVCGLVGRNLQSINIIAYVLHRPIGLVRKCSVNKACCDVFTNSFVIPCPIEDFIVLAGVFGIEIVVAASYKPKLEAHRFLAYDGLCAPCFALGQEASGSHIVKVEILVSCKFRKTTTCVVAHFFDSPKAIPRF